MRRFLNVVENPFAIIRAFVDCELPNSRNETVLFHNDETMPLSLALKSGRK